MEKNFWNPILSFKLSTVKQEVHFRSDVGWGREPTGEPIEQSYCQSTFIALHDFNTHGIPQYNAMKPKSMDSVYGKS